MKKAFLGLAATAILFASCKKDEDSGPSNSWTVGSNTYTASAVSSSTAGGGYTLTATNGTNTIAFYFNATPAAGTYVVGGSGANSIDFIAASTTGGYSTGLLDSVNATIAVNSGKVSLSMPSVKAFSISGSDSTTVSANLTEN